MMRFCLSILLLLISLLTVCPAPAYPLWLLAIAVTEYPLVFAAIVVAVLLSGFWLKGYQLVSTIAGIAALLLFLSPIARAYNVATLLQKDIGEAMKSINSILRTQPFSFTKLFVSSPAMPFTSMVYVKYADTELSLDFYPAQVPGKRPCVLVIHGGSWSSGDSRQLPELNSYLAKAGYNVAAINYRKAPKYISPAPLEDVRNALKYLRANAGRLDIDTNNLVLLGRSAGAQVAMLAAYTLKNSGIKGVVDFYGPADMVWGYSLPANPLVMDSRGVMERYLGGTYNNVPENYKLSSPIEFIDKDSPPTLIIHGANDVLVAYEHSRRLTARLQQFGIRHYWLKLPWATHGFDYNLNGPGGQLSTFAVHQFLEGITRDETLPAKNS